MQGHGGISCDAENPDTSDEGRTASNGIRGPRCPGVIISGRTGLLARGTGREGGWEKISWPEISL